MSAPDWTRQNFKKTSNKVEYGVKDCGSLFHGAKPMQRLADGDTEETYKARGIEASASDNGLWARLKAGNIDDPNSEAYHRYGAGRGKSEASRAASDIDNESISSGLSEDRRMTSAASTMRSAVDADDATRSEGVRTGGSDDFMTSKEPGWETAAAPVARPSAAVRRAAPKPAPAPASSRTADDDSEMSRIRSRAEAASSARASSSPAKADDTPAPRRNNPPGIYTGTKEQWGQYRMRQGAERDQSNQSSAEVERLIRQNSEAKAKRPSGRGVINTSNIDSKTLLPRR